MSLDKHSLGDGAPHSWSVPALRPLPARRQAQWRVTPSGCLPPNSSGGPPWRRPPLAAIKPTRSFTVLPYPPEGWADARVIPFITVGSRAQLCRPHRIGRQQGPNQPLAWFAPESMRQEHWLLSRCQTVAVMDQG